MAQPDPLRAPHNQGIISLEIGLAPLGCQAKPALGLLRQNPANWGQF